MEKPLASSWQQILSHNHYRLTAPRMAVLDVIASTTLTMNPMEVYLEARRICPGLGLVTVYRTIEKLEELGLVQRVHLPDGCHSFIAASAGRQHLIICARCNKAEFFSGEDLIPNLDLLQETCGFIIHDYRVQLTGLCESCQQEDYKNQ